MILTTQDKNELLKAAIKTTDRQTALWLVSVVDAIDNLPDGKSGAPCPPYRPAHTGPETRDT